MCKLSTVASYLERLCCAASEAKNRLPLVPLLFHRLTSQSLNVSLKNMCENSDFRGDMTYGVKAVQGLKSVRETSNHERFVSGHDLGRAEKHYKDWALERV
jgi:hypothetical protein